MKCIDVVFGRLHVLHVLETYSRFVHPCPSKEYVPPQTACISSTILKRSTAVAIRPQHTRKHISAGAKLYRCFLACSLPLAAKLNQVPLPSWPHARDTLTIWKRHSFCAIHYDDSEEEESEGEEQEEGVTKKDGGVEGDEDDGTGSSLGSDHGVFASAKSVGKAPAGPADGAAEGGGEDSSGDDEGSLVFGSDDDGSMEGLPIGLPDVDMYAFVPEAEQMPSARAAPCLRFLLDA